ncbi:MAG: nitroreductase family deazaflavin-dependent oxidoreductase [Gordonia sp. (in: high G+C Gram-positive bacteria)]
MGLLTPAAVRVGSVPWLSKYLPQIVKVDEAIQWATGGNVDLLRIAGLPSVTMTIPGRKSGAPRVTTVLAAPENDHPADGGDLSSSWLVAGSYFGGPKTPTWVYNLRAASTIDVERRGRHARTAPAELDGDEYAEAWDLLESVWPNFALYKKRTDRTIPVFRLTPVSGD